MLITDGHSSKTASVTDKNRLKTKSSTIPEIHQVSIEDEFAFIADLSFTSAVTTNGNVLYLRNADPSRVIVVDSVSLIAEGVTAGGNVFGLSRNPSIVTEPLTNIVTPTVPPVNLNFGSGKQGLVVFEQWDEVAPGIGGLTDIRVFATEPILNGDNKIEVGGSIILSQGDGLGVNVVTAEILTCIAEIVYYMVTEGT